MKRKFFVLLLMVASIIMMAGCVPSESIYNNQLVSDVSISKLDTGIVGKTTHYYATFSVDGEEKKYQITGDDPQGISKEIENYLKSSAFNGVDPKFNLIVDDKDQVIRAIAIVSKSKEAS